MFQEFKCKAYIKSLNIVAKVITIHFSEETVEVELPLNEGRNYVYPFYEVELLPYIQKNDKLGQNIYLGDVLSIIGETTEGFYRKDYFEVIWDENQSEFVLSREGLIYNNPNLFDISVVEGNKFENPDFISHPYEAIDFFAIEL